MPKGQNKEKKLIAWDGLHLIIPSGWDARISGHRHLVFEKDFQPQLQIRWERSVQQPPDYLQKKVSQFAGKKGTIIPEDGLPWELQQLRAKFSQVTCYREESAMVKGGICLCADCNSLILFQLLCSNAELLQELGECLSTASCHSHSETLWRMQDFSLTLPVSYILKDYTFGAGLTRLSFCSSHLFLQTCKLGPADIRLNNQSLVEILTTLTNASGLEMVIGEDYNSCEGQRSPTIPKQIILRFRREKPFIRARIWHDTANNQLLAVVLSSNRPIPSSTTNEICSQYEIVQKESGA